MERAQRAELIREMYRAKVGGMAYRHSGKPLRPNTDPIEGPGFGVWGKGGLCFKPALPKPAPTREKKVTPRANHRRKGESAITRISRLLPAKLPVVLRHGEL
jgi:hypothetical protein